MVHFEHAAATCGAVVGSVRFFGLAFLAKTSVAGRFNGKRRKTGMAGGFVRREVGIFVSGGV